jgi:hypothetical protein
VVYKVSLGFTGLMKHTGKIAYQHICIVFFQHTSVLQSLGLVCTMGVQRIMDERQETYILKYHFFKSDDTVMKNC